MMDRNNTMKYCNHGKGTPNNMMREYASGNM